MNTVDSNSLCDSCNAACCQPNTTLALTQTEAEYFLANGANLNLVRQLRAAPVGERALYLMSTVCPFLDLQTYRCTIYNDPNKPAVCDQFLPGTDECLDMREKRFHRPNPRFEALRQGR